MKKIILTLATIILAAGAVNAQDIATATETIRSNAGLSVRILKPLEKAEAKVSIRPVEPSAYVAG